MPTLNTRHIEWGPTGRKSELLDENNQPYSPPKYVWSGTIGQQNTQDDGVWKPYVYKDDNLIYGHQQWGCKFEDTHQYISKLGVKLVETMKVYVDVEHPSQPGVWLPAPHGIPTRNILHNKRFRNHEIIDAEGFCIGYLEFPNAQLPNSTSYNLQIGIQAGRKNKPALGFRFNTSVSGRVRFQIVLDGVNKFSNSNGFSLLRNTGGKGTEERIVGIVYKDLAWRWTWEEAEYRSISVEDSTEYSGKKKGIITIGPFDYSANDWINITPDTWGTPTETGHDCSLYHGTFKEYYTRDGRRVHYIGKYGASGDGAGFRWTNVEVPAGATIDYGTYMLIRSNFYNGDPDIDFYCASRNGQKYHQDWSDGTYDPSNVTKFGAAYKYNWTKRIDSELSEIKSDFTNTAVMIQPRISETGFDSGGDLIIVAMYDDASDHSDVISEDDASYDGMKLKIVYTAAGGVVAPTGNINGPLVGAMGGPI